jgi:uncharacterized cupredoxin-like copper-binding protein
MLLVAACSSSEAEPTTTDPVLSATQPVVTTATPSPTPLPRKTPSGTGTGYYAPGLIAKYTKVRISNGSLTIADARMEAEEVYFETTFGDDGGEHQVSVVRWDGDPAALPVDASSRQVTGVEFQLNTAPVESGNQQLYEVEPIAPGKYVIFCNMPGHYKSGEFAGFEVVSPPPGATR